MSSAWSIQTLAVLRGHAAPLIAAACAVDGADAAAVARLRREWPADLVAAALGVTEARRRGRGKFGQRADALWADRQGLEQASSLRVAVHKAQRFAELAREYEVGRVIDLCCGIGGDAMGLAACGLEVVGVDHDPARAWMTRANARCPAAAADVTGLPLRHRVFHLDPARRDEARGRRVWRFDDCQPGPAFMGDLLARCPDGAVKLGPGMDASSLPIVHDAGSANELEYISEAGRLVQAVWWTGRLALCMVSATLLTDDGCTHTIARDATAESPTPVVPVQRYLYTIDPAVERANLIPVLCNSLDIAAIHPSLGLLTSDRVIENPWLTPFELIEQMPWRPKRVKGWLAAHNAGVVEVKTRGGAVDPAAAQKQLRGEGGQAYTVFVMRWRRKVAAMITRRL